jgi:Tfp pilus assembly protein PilN
MRAVNLVPEHRRSGHSAGRFAAIWANPAILGVAALAVAVAGGFAALNHSVSSSLSTRQARLGELQSQLAAMPPPKPVGAQLSGAVGRVNALNAAASGRLPFDALIGAFSKVVPEDVWLLSLQATSPDYAPTATAPGTAPAPASTTGTTTTLFTINGYTYSQRSVARLMKRLTLIPWLSSVQLQSSAMSELGKRRLYQFTIGAEVLNEELAS